jgi:hypothetical protein
MINTTINAIIDIIFVFLFSVAAKLAMTMPDLVPRPSLCSSPM